MIACVTAEEHQPENVESAEHDSSSSLSSSSSSPFVSLRSVSLKVQLIVRQVKASTDEEKKNCGDIESSETCLASFVQSLALGKHVPGSILSSQFPTPASGGAQVRVIENRRAV